MIKPFLLVGSLILIMALVLACGGAAEPTAVPPTAAAPTDTPAPAPTATEAAMEEEDSAMMDDIDPALKAAAAERAGKPGAFYISDLTQLVGPSPDEGLENWPESGGSRVSGYTWVQQS